MKAVSRRSFLKSIVLVSGAGIISACTPQPPPESDDTKTENETQAVASSPAGKKTVIEMWMWETEPRWKQVEAAAKLDEKYPDVEFKWTGLPFDQLHQKAITSLAAGIVEGLPAILRTGAAYYPALVATKAIMDTTDVVNPYQKDILPSTYDQMMVGGKSYQFPDDTGITLWGYRWDLLEKAGYPSDPEELADLIKTWDDLIQHSKEMVEKTNAQLFTMSPQQAGGGGMFNIAHLQDTTGYFDANGEVIFDSPQHIECANLARRFWDAGVTLNVEFGSPQFWQAIKEDKILFTPWHNWEDFVFIDNAPETKFKWRVMKLPAVMAGGKRVGPQDGCQLVVPAILPNETKELAVKIATELKLTVEGTLAHMKTFSGAFVSYVPGLEAMKNEPSEMLEGQFCYQYFLKVAQDEKMLPWYRTSQVFNEADTAANEALFKIISDKAPIEETLKSAANSIRDLQKMKGIK